ncbi:MAG: GspH/FimT family protein [Agarilytica sp.]
MAYKTCKGITLFDLLISIAVVSIIITQAIPSFVGLVAKSQLITQRDAFLSTLQFARSEAITRNQDVYMCARHEDELTCSEENKWQAGWIVYVDENKNRELDEEEVIRLMEGVQEEYSLASNANIYDFQFRSNGSLRRGNGALPMMTFNLCAPNAEENIESRAYEIVINRGGRARTHQGIEDETDCSTI